MSDCYAHSLHGDVSVVDAVAAEPGAYAAVCVAIVVPGSVAQVIFPPYDTDEN
ncbi:MAG: hypothetical protein IJN29_13140 [Akkermansia sp.]|nr:hypothetical protein [Akkermansia sp.]